jgi:hypothetical protein
LGSLSKRASSYEFGRLLCLARLGNCVSAYISISSVDTEMLALLGHGMGTFSLLGRLGGGHDHDFLIVL